MKEGRTWGPPVIYIKRESAAKTRLAGVRRGTALYNSGSKQIVGGGLIHVSEGGRVTGLAFLCQVYVQSIGRVQSEQQLIVCYTQTIESPCIYR